MEWRWAAGGTGEGGGSDDGMDMSSDEERPVAEAPGGDAAPAPPLSEADAESAARAKRGQSEALVAQLRELNALIVQEDFGDAKGANLCAANAPARERWLAQWTPPSVDLWLRPEVVAALGYERIRVALPLMPWRTTLGTLLIPCVRPDGLDAASGRQVLAALQPSEGIVDLVRWFAGHTAYHLLVSETLLWSAFTRDMYSAQASRPRPAHDEGYKVWTWQPFSARMRAWYLSYARAVLAEAGGHLLFARSKPDMLRLCDLAERACSTDCPAEHLLPEPLRAVLRASCLRADCSDHYEAVQGTDVTLLVGTWELLRFANRSRGYSYVDALEAAAASASPPDDGDDAPMAIAVADPTL